MSSRPLPQMAVEMPAADYVSELPTTTTSHTSQPIPVQYQSAGTTYQDLPIPIESTNQATATTPAIAQQQQLPGPTGVVYQELPTSNTTVMSQGQGRGGISGAQQQHGVVYQELPTAAQLTTTTVNSDPIKVDYYTPARVLSDQFPTPVSYQHPPPHPSQSPAPSYSAGATGAGGGYFAPTLDEKIATTTTTTTTTGLEHYSPNQGGVGGVGYYQQQQAVSQPLMQPQGQDLENPVMGHGGVVVPGKPPRKMVNCCGRQFAQKTVVILSILAAVLVIIVIGLGAGLGAEGASSKESWW